MFKTKKTVLALAAVMAAVFSFVSCSNDDDDDDDSNQNLSQTSLVSSYVGTIYGCKVENKLIYKLVEVTSDTEVVSTQFKYGNVTAKNYYTFTAASDNGSVVLSCYEHDEGATAETVGDSDTTITFATSSDGTVSITSSYYEGETLNTTTNDYVPVYSFDDLVGNYYKYTVSGKNIYTLYNFIDSETVEVSLVKYGTVNTDIVYTYEATSAHGGLVAADTFSRTDESTDINSYTLNLTVKEVKTYTNSSASYYGVEDDSASSAPEVGEESTSYLTIDDASTVSIKAIASYYGSSGYYETQSYELVTD